MKKLTLCYLILLSVNAFCQTSAGVVKMDVPAITLGENQNYQILSFEPVGQDKYSILYMQELPASIVGAKEYKIEKYDGAWGNKDTTEFVQNSNRVIFLVRQTVNKTGETSTNFWVIAVRELLSDMKYTMYYPTNFVHPIIKDAIEVNYNLKHLEQVKGLTTHEFEALVLMGKERYGFYDYPTAKSSYRESTFEENMKLLKDGFKEMKAALGKGDIPKQEKVLFKRELTDKVRLTATRLDKGDSAEIKLYIAYSDDANYELLKAQTFYGTVNPGFSTALIYDQTLKISGAYGYVLLKYKDANGAAKANFLAIGIDGNSDPQFWKIEAAKNTLNSFLPWFSYIGTDNEVYVISRNQEKIFKPYYQHHILKHDGSTATLYPANETEIGTEKREYKYTEQQKAPVNSGTTGYASVTREDFPIGLLNLNKSKFVFTGVKLSSNNGTAVVTSIGNLSVMRIDGDNKIRESYELQENQSAANVYPRLLGQYSDKAFFTVNYPNKFKLVVSESSIETEQLENNVYRMVYGINKDYLSANQFGAMFLTKSIVGNKYTLEFFPGN